MKTFLGIAVGLIVLLFLASFVIAFSLGSIVKRGVNTYGPQYTQTTVSLASAEISPLSGKGSLNKLVVGNPTGWQSDHAFSLGTISVELAPRSLIGDHIVVNRLLIDSPDIVYEAKLTSSNLQDLLKNIQQATKSADNTAAQPGEKNPPKKIEVVSLTLTNAKITVIAGGRTQVVNVPSINLENLGTNQGGLTPPALAAAIVKELSRQALQSAAQGMLNLGSIDKVSSKAADGLRQLFGSEKSTAAKP